MLFFLSFLSGSVEVGKLADLVIWKPEFFGAKCELVLKSGVIAAAQMGDANASIPTPECSQMRRMFAAQGSASSSCSRLFVSQKAADTNIGER